MAHIDNKWDLVTEYGLREYANGLKAGDRVRLRNELIIVGAGNTVDPWTRRS